jgi:hypothetical protein
VHHINGDRGGENDELDNLVPLCIICHSKVHRTGRDDFATDAYPERIRLLQRCIADGGEASEALKSVSFKLAQWRLDLLDERAEKAGVDRSTFIREQLDRRAVTIDKDSSRLINEWIDDGRFELPAEAANWAIQQVDEAVRRVDELEGEIEAVRARRDDLRRQLAAQNRRSGELDQVVEYATGEMEKQDRERERRDAPAWVRAKWWLFGRPSTAED